ncbi:hypothetical protein LZ31DRAFT_37113 [Colletotrichum somersetense]|nr:hypothetical protein LZ31DRAFT_37113 [Colletotrichum somersetense]
MCFYSFLLLFSNPAALGTKRVYIHTYSPGLLLGDGGWLHIAWFTWTLAKSKTGGRWHSCDSVLHVCIGHSLVLRLRNEVDKITAPCSSLKLFMSPLVIAKEQISSRQRNTQPRCS